MEERKDDEAANNEKNTTKGILAGKGSENKESSFDNRIEDTRRKVGRSSKLNVDDGTPSKLEKEKRKASGNYLDSARNWTGEKLMMEAERNAGTRDRKTIAEELNGRATDSGARVSESLSAGAHPGMLVLAGAALGAAAALTVVLSRRATVRRRERYQRQENIEVHTLTPTTELW